MLVPLVIAIIALLLGGYLAWLTWLKPTPTPVLPTAAGPGSAAGPGTTQVHLASKALNIPKGGYTVSVPQGLTGRRVGRSAYLTNAGHSVVVVIGPSQAGSLAKTNSAIIAAMKHSYRNVVVTGHQSESVHGRAALATSGSALNAHGSQLRFVQLTVAAKPRNFTIATYAGAGTNPRWVLPRVDLVINSFRVRR